MAVPWSLQRSISPPPTRLFSRTGVDTHQALPSETIGKVSGGQPSEGPSPAAVEAGQAQVRDHLAYFVSHLHAASRPPVLNSPRLSIKAWKELYMRNQNPLGRQFVVHQHDHPISGVHYDLRLQFSADSSISFAVPYGLPGNPNSTRPMRMAIETRVHCLWNHLIESASHATGSLVIWDTGEYEVIDRPRTSKARDTDDEDSDIMEARLEKPVESKLPDSEKLIRAFKSKHIRLRLHGSRLPEQYTISIRLPSANDTSGATPRKPRFKRRRRAEPRNAALIDAQTTDDEEGKTSSQIRDPASKRSTSHSSDGEMNEVQDVAEASGDGEDDAIRTNNAYPGSRNTIGSIHQRRWFLSLDKVSSGFIKSTMTDKWIHSETHDENETDNNGGWDAFYVRGRDYERSVITGRLATDVMQDEGVKNYKARKMWRAIME